MQLSGTTMATPPEDYYFNEQGLLVMTEAAHVRRGHCCGSRCMHCPYEYAAVLGLPSPRPPFVLRHAQENDVIQLALLARQTFVAACLRHGVDIDAELLKYLDRSFCVDKIADSIQDRSRNWWIAVDQADRSWGYAKAKLTRVGKSPRGLQLQRLYVRSQAKGLGLGSALLAEVEAFAKTHEFLQVWVSVLKANTAAQSFFLTRSYEHLQDFSFDLSTQSFKLAVLARKMEPRSH